MRWLVVTASLIAALGTGMSRSAYAQDPPPPPPPTPEPAPPPPVRERAVPRAERVREPAESAAERQQRVTREPEPARDTQPAAATQAQPTERSGAVRREAVRNDGTRETVSETRTSAESANRRSPATPVAAAPSAPIAASAEQSGERPGAVRRPPAGGRDSSNPRDRAVVRTGPPPNRDHDHDYDRVYVYPDYWAYGHYYDPFYYGGFHIGYLSYSPWGWVPAFYGYPYAYGGGYYPGYQPHGYDLGRVRLKVDQRDAEVFVDGYYAGTVDDFDGMFQALRLDSGGYRIEIRKPGFETLQFDVRVQPDRTITYRGDMRATP